MSWQHYSYLSYLFLLVILFGTTTTLNIKEKSRTGNFAISVQFGNNVAPQVQKRISTHLESFLLTTSADVRINQNGNTDRLFGGENVQLSFGSTNASDSFISPTDLAELGPEGFIIRSGYLNDGTFCLVANGNPKEGAAYSIGAAFGSFALLSELGFGFLHPLQPQIPQTLQIDSRSKINIVEKPHWPFRNWHIHTEHPLELTELLNGFGENFSTSNRADWEIMLPGWYSFLDWMLANRLNAVEWVLLSADDWIDFSWSSERLNRIQILTTAGHDFGIEMGADLPIADTQQHAWYMIKSPSGTLEQQTKELHTSLDWLNAAGFDFLSTESGFSEFTHPDDILMLTWMNITTQYLNQLNKTAYIKVHCSTGQTCSHFTNPWNGQPLNFNWLPIYADPNLGIFPHTVQFYTFDEPSGNSYGNANFSYIFDLITKEAGKRDVIYFGETAYWVNYDIDVPLFLPIYGRARMVDLRMIAKFEAESNLKIQGYGNFDSGWEWGYWFSDVVTARAMWDPLIDLDEESALRTLIHDTTTRYFGQISKQAEDLLVELIELEKQLLIFGNVTGNEQIVNAQYKRNGQAYLEGWDTWSDISCDFTTMGCTQPNRLGLDECRNPFSSSPNYHKQVRPILEAMATNFTDIYNRMNDLSDLVDPTFSPLWDEIVDATHMTALRATQVFALYEYAANWYNIEKYEYRQQQLRIAQSVIANSSVVIKQRESQYRVPLDRIAGWRQNPTAYPYGYLWTVHSQMYQYRDYARATIEDMDTFSPCFMNIINPADVVIGEGIALNMTELAREVLTKLGLLDFLADCLAAPKKEPHYSLK